MAPETQTVVQSAQSWLQSSCHVQVPFAWLEACVQWLQEEAGGVGHLSQQQVNQQVYDQWLLTDLRDLDHPVLPDGLAQAQKTVLSGTFCVQVDSVLDISQPAYGQLQKWKGTDCANDEVSTVTQFSQKPWEVKPTRMLLLQVTDGIQNLEAMEYQPITALSTSLRPGVKLQLQGEIICRLGTLLLKPSNVKLLGGEVEDLVERNQQVKVLCRVLGLPEEEEQQQRQQEEEEEAPPSAQQGNQDFDDLALDDQELLASLEAQERADRRVGSARDSGYGTLSEGTQSSRSSSVRTHGSTASSSREVSTSSYRSGVTQSSSGDSIQGHYHGNKPEDSDVLDHFPPDPPNQDQSMAHQDFPDEDFDDLPLDELDSIIHQEDITVQPQRPQTAQTSVAHNDDDFLDEDMDFIQQLETTELDHRPSDNPRSSVSMTLTSPPFTYICLLDDSLNKLNPPKTEILVKAFIVTLLGKLGCSDGLWRVSATISDGTGYLDVELSDEVLTGLLGFSVAQKAALKRDPARKGELEAGMRRCQEGLVDMCCLMTIAVDQEGGKAVVTKAEPVKEEDLQALEQRVKARK